ncbi:UNVERIFIED_CONTAM: hypothetical protein FKN15_031545, partial [Acipenser sinensis]
GNLSFSCVETHAVPVFFNATSYLQLPGRANRNEMSVSFQFRTWNPSGLLLYSTFAEGLGMVEVDLNEGKVSAHINLTQTKKSRIDISSGSGLHDGQWHNVRFLAKENFAMLTIDGDEASAVRTNSPLYIKTGNKYYFGGYFPQMNNSSRSPVQRSFQGCMQLIHVDDQMADLHAVEQGKLGSFENVSIDMCAIIDRKTSHALYLVQKDQPCSLPGAERPAMLFTWCRKTSHALYLVQKDQPCSLPGAERPAMLFTWCRKTSHALYLVQKDQPCSLPGAERPAMLFTWCRKTSHALYLVQKDQPCSLPGAERPAMLFTWCRKTSHALYLVQKDQPCSLPGAERPAMLFTWCRKTSHALYLVQKDQPCSLPGAERPAMLFTWCRKTSHALYLVQKDQPCSLPGAERPAMLFTWCRKTSHALYLVQKDQPCSLPGAERPAMLFTWCRRDIVKLYYILSMRVRVI